MTDTFGRLLYEPSRTMGRWIVDNLEPHVAITFKRMFPRVPAHETTLKLSDTDDVRADLLWFLARYPLETQHRALLEEGDKRLRDRLAHRGKILMPEWKPGEVFGFREGKAPYLYQQQAATIALAQGGLLLADEVGLGKTVSALTALAQGAPLPAAIVVQSHLAFQWAEKIEEFTDFTWHIIDKQTPYSVPKADIYIFKYTNVGGWADVVKKGFLKSVFYDEVQELRTGTETAKGKACSLISQRADFRMGLTATATYNYGDEIHTVMEFIKPDILGGRDEFLLEWCSSGRQVKDPDGLGSYLKSSGWLLRRTEDDETVNRSMPKPNVIDMEVGWDDDAAADDLALMQTLALSVMQGSFAEAGRASRELDAKMRHMTGVAKARSVAAYVQMLLRDTRRVVLVGWHRDVYDKWLRMLAPYNPVLYTGSETAVQKVASINRFCRGDSRVFIMSLRSGAGLDGLQHFCNDIVFGEFDWSPQVHHQCGGRLRRPGQKERVNAHYLWTNEGSDPVMIETLGVKSDQARGIHDPGVAQAPKVVDETRIKRLAQSVLAAVEAEVQPCAICGGPSAGGPKHIIPLHEAFEYEEGPERDALYGPENIWFLCEDHVSR